MLSLWRKNREFLNMSFETIKTRDGKEIKYIRPEEARRVISALEGGDRLLVEILWNTGARIGEVMELTLEAVDFDNKTIAIRNTQKKKTLPKEGKDLKNEIMGLELALRRESGPPLKERLEQAKEELLKIEYIQPTSHYRIIPILPELTNHIAKHCADKRIRKKDKIFAFSGVRAYLIIREAAERAGIEKGRRHPSAFRHGFAVNATLAGMPPFVLNNWLGHTNIVSTLIYTAALSQDARGYLEKMKL